MRLSWSNRKNIEKGEVEDTDRPLKSLVSLLPGVYYRMVLEPEYHFSDLSEGIISLLGYPVNKFLDKSSFSRLRLIYPEHDEILEQKKRLCFENKEPSKLKYHLVTKAETPMWVEDRFVGEFDDLGRLIAIQGYIKESKKESARSRLNNQLEAYREAIDVNIISSITDSKGIITYANENFKKVSQFTDDELLGKTHSIVNSGYHNRSFFENLWGTISNGKMWTGELLNRAKDGSLYWVETVIIPIFDRNRNIVSYLSLRILITDRKQAEQQKEKYISALEQISQVVSHDFRGPVTTLLGLVDMFGKDECNNPDLKKASEFVFSAANKLDEITRELSDRIQAAKVDTKKTDAHLQN